jgi:type I restriction enzyme S subunit
MKTWCRIPDYLWFQEGPGVRKKQYTAQGVKLLNVANLADGRLNLAASDRYISEQEAYGRYRHFLVDAGDLLVAASGIQVESFDRKMGLAQPEHLPLCMNTGTVRFKVLDEKLLDIRYFMYYLKTPHFKAQLEKQITGAAQLNFGPTHLKNMVFPLTERRRQTEIADTLSHIGGLIEKSRAAEEKLRLMLKARFTECFGDPLAGTAAYPVCKLREVCEKITDGVHFRPEYREQGVPFLSAANISGGRLSFAGCKFISAEAYQRMSRSARPEKGDVLYTKIGTCGVPAYVDTETAFGLYVSVCLLRPDRAKMSGRFLAEQLGMPFVRHQAAQRVRGIGVPDLHLNQIAEFEVICPPRAEQEAFAAFAEQTARLTEAVQRRTARLQTVQAALMQKFYE